MESNQPATEEPIAYIQIWLALAAYIVIMFVAYLDRIWGVAGESVTSNASHPLWVQLPIYIATPFVLVLTWRKMRRMPQVLATERLGSRVAVGLVLVNALATTRLTIHHLDACILVRTVGIVVWRYDVPDSYDGGCCYQSYERGFRSVSVNEAYILPPWLPLPVDWHEFENEESNICPKRLLRP